MLVLTRRQDESIVIDDRIVVTVLAVEGDKVKIGITAPRDVTILRQELHQAVIEQNMIASRLAASPEQDAFQELREMLAEEARQTDPSSETEEGPGQEEAKSPGENSAE